LDGPQGRGYTLNVNELLRDEYFMREALRQAQKANAGNEVPVGAVIVRDGKIIRIWRYDDSGALEPHK